MGSGFTLTGALTWERDRVKRRAIITGDHIKCLPGPVELDTSSVWMDLFS